jgi:hypothetical protein
VPASHVAALVDHAEGESRPQPDLGLKKDAAIQLRAHSAHLLGALDGEMKTQAVAGYKLPDKIASFVHCSAAGNPETYDPVQTLQFKCSAKAGLYVQAGLYSGDIKYAHFVLTTSKLDAWRFASRLSGLTRAVGRFGALRHVGPYACEDRVVGLKGFDASLLVCTRGYRRLEGLYDFTVRVSSLNSSQQGFASHLDMYGLEFEAGMRFIRRYVEAMEWNP